MNLEALMLDKIGFEVELDQPYEDVIDLVTQALKTEGFGVLTEIDVKTTLKKKLDVDFRPYVIFGACNPHLAHQALSTIPEVGMMLPCNVTVESKEDGGTIVRILDPNVMIAVGPLADNPTLAKVAGEAHDKLARVAQVLAA
jgi:uncharacterized protein (DUF302 family)